MNTTYSRAAAARALRTDTPASSLEVSDRTRIPIQSTPPDSASSGLREDVGERMGVDAETVLRAEGLTKVYRPPAGLRRLLMRSPITEPITAVNEVDLDIKRGEIFGLLGPNGAGKTTLIKVFTTLVRPSSGRASVCGYDVIEAEDDVRRKIGVTIGEERSFYYRLTGRQNLAFFASLADVRGLEAERRINDSLRLMDLESDADNMFYSYSSGMRQKLAIARALLAEPEVLFLDEPTKNIDALAANDLKRLIKQRLAIDGGRTVVLATHRMEEAEQLCDRIAIVREGRIAFCGTVSELRVLVGGTEECVVRLRGSDMAECMRLANSLRLADPALDRLDDDEAIELRFKRRADDDQLSGVLSALLAAGATVQSVELRRRGLEDMFVDVVRGPAHAG